MHPMMNIGIRAVRSAGDFIIRSMDQLQGIEVTEKSRNDYVSEVDRRAELMIIDILRKAYPDHAILAEESGRQGGGDYQWIIDTLDGTTNFLHGFPQFAISVAFKHRGILNQGIIYDPLRQELFTASRGRRRPPGWPAYPCCPVEFTGRRPDRHRFSVSIHCTGSIAISRCSENQLPSLPV